MDDERKLEIIQLARDLEELNHLIAILEGIFERLRKDTNKMLKHLKEENGGEIGFDKEDDTS